MIVVRLRGGLGNQLFQYAAGRALADHHGTELKLDVYTYTKHKYRKFELQNFQVDTVIVSRQEVHRYTGANMVSRFLNKQGNYLHCPSVFVQPHYHYYDDFLELPADIYLSGYWQSEKYFSTIRESIRKEYTPRHPLDTRNLELIDRMKASESVSVHVRRGDYLNKGYTGFFGGVPEGYYEKAISVVRQKIKDPQFFIFSDDIEWCRKNLSIDGSVFVDDNKGDDSYKDLFLMSACRHQVIANSTFSWWGAWLNQNSTATIVAPQPWFRKTYSEQRNPVYPCRYYNTKDLLPAHWIKVE